MPDIISRRFMAAVAIAAAVAVPVMLGGAPARGAILAGQADTFEDGTVLGWQAGANNPNGPANVATGGPAGAGDGYLRLTSNGTFTAGGKLVAFNADQWAGDYLDAGVSAISMRVNNLGATDLSLRLILVGAQNLTTVAGVNVPAGGGWTSVSFPLTPANLSGGDFDSGMAAVAELNLVHSPAVVTNRSFAPNVAAQLGVDDVTAVPEPGTFTAVAALAGAAGLAIRSRATHRPKRVRVRSATDIQ